MNKRNTTKLVPTETFEAMMARLRKSKEERAAEIVSRNPGKRNRKNARQRSLKVREGPRNPNNPMITNLNTTPSNVKGNASGKGRNQSIRNKELVRSVSGRQGNIPGLRSKHAKTRVLPACVLQPKTSRLVKTTAVERLDNGSRVPCRLDSLILPHCTQALIRLPKVYPVNRRPSRPTPQPEKSTCDLSASESCLGGPHDNESHAEQVHLKHVNKINKNKEISNDSSLKTCDKNAKH